MIRLLSLPGMGNGGSVGNLHMEYLWSIFQAVKEMAERVHPVSAFSLLPMAQKNPYARVVYLRVVYTDLLHHM